MVERILHISWATTTVISCVGKGSEYDGSRIKSFLYSIPTNSHFLLVGYEEHLTNRELIKRNKVSRLNRNAVTNLSYRKKPLQCVKCRKESRFPIFRKVPVRFLLAWLSLCYCNVLFSNSSALVALAFSWRFSGYYVLESFDIRAPARLIECKSYNCGLWAKSMTQWAEEEELIAVH